MMGVKLTTTFLV